MIVNRLFLSATLLGLGVLLPTAAHSLTPTYPTPPASIPANGSSQTTAQPTPSAAVDLELQLSPEQNGIIDHEVTFRGNANETIVVHVQRADGMTHGAFQTVELYDPAGGSVRSRRNYPDLMSFENTDGIHWTFLLPETGTYRLTFTAESMSTRNSSEPVAVSDHSLQVRQATYYERLLMAADTFTRAGDYDAAFSRLTLAIEESPDMLGAYVQRLFSYAGMLYETSEFEAKLDELASDETNVGAQLELGLFALIHETFLTLPDVDQALVIDDLREVNQQYLDAIAQGKLQLDEDELAQFGGEKPLFEGLAEFLETGIPTESMKLLFFGIEQQTQEAL